MRFLFQHRPATSPLARLGALLCLLFIIAAFMPGHTRAADGKPIPFKTAWLGENEAFPVWYAVQQGWDREAGLAVDMMRFDTGRAVLEGMQAYEWVIAGCGALPVIASPLNDAVVIIAAANDESMANVVLVRKDSPILARKGARADYPDVCGDAATVKHARIICPKGTSAHYTMVLWLYTLGLTEKDVKVQYLEPAQAIGAFRRGLGDALVLWSPWTAGAEKDGISVAATAAACDAHQPTLLVANKAQTANRRQDVQAFLQCYLRAVDAITAALESEDMAMTYQRFLKEWAGHDVDLATASRDLHVHHLFTATEQQDLFDTRRGESTLRLWLKDMTGFFGALTPSPETRSLEAKVPDIAAQYINTIKQ